MSIKLKCLKKLTNYTYNYIDICSALTLNNCWKRCFRWRLRLFWLYMSLICLQRVKRQTMTEVEAFTECNDAFQQSTYYDTCFSDVPNFSNETIVNCMRDLAVSVCFISKTSISIHFMISRKKTNEYVNLLFTGNWGS